MGAGPVAGAMVISSSHDMDATDDPPRVRQALLEHALDPHLGPCSWTPRLPHERFWSVLADVEWPDLLPPDDAPLEDIYAVIDPAVDRLVRATSFFERVAFQERYLEQAKTFSKRLRDWDAAGAPVARPKGVHAHVLAAYAVQRGREAYEAAIADPEACARLVQQPGLISLSRSLFGFEEVLARALARAADAEIGAFVHEVAVRDTRGLADGPRDRSVLHHPRFGPGVVVDETWDPPTIKVAFEDGERVLVGDERFWAPVRERFLDAALALVEDAVGEASEAGFWALVEPLGWGTRSTDRDALAQTLREKAPLPERMRVASRFWTLRGKLEDALRAWEAKSRRTIPVGDDAFGDLVSHIIGLGRTEYEATLRRPKQAFDRAERRDYEESFAYVVLGGVRGSSQEEIEALLRDHGVVTPEAATRLVAHPQLGLGVRVDGGGGASTVLFYDRELPLAQGLGPRG